MINSTQNNNRAALYIRVSTEEQAQEGWSIDAQERALRNFCQTKDWQVVEIFKDEGRTGTNTDRPGFQAMLQAARNRSFDTVVVHKLDRFSRNLEDVLRILGELERWSVTFVSATEANMDFTTPYGRMMLGVMGTMSQWYVDNLRTETTKGKKERFEQGLFNGDLRFGYSKAEDGRPEPNDDAEGVRLAYQLAAQGKTDAEAARLLNAAGYRTYRLIEDNRKKATPDVDPRLRRPWTKDSVASLLRAGQFYLGNTEYVGEGERKLRTRANQRGENYALQKQLQMDTHPAIITQEMFKLATEARSMRASAGRAATPQLFKTYLLGAGLACCAHCGEPLRCTSSFHGRYYLYYRCTANWRGNQCSSGQRQLREDYLQPQLDDLINQLMLPADWRDRVEEILASNDGPSEESVEHQRKELHEELRRLSFQHQKNLISDDEYFRRAAPIGEELDHIDKQVASRVPANVTAAGEQFISIRSSWHSASPEQRRDMLHLIFKAVYVDTDERFIVSVVPHDEFELLFTQTPLKRESGRYLFVKPADQEMA